MDEDGRLKKKKKKRPIQLRFYICAEKNIYVPVLLMSEKSIMT